MFTYISYNRNKDIIDATWQNLTMSLKQAPKPRKIPQQSRSLHLVAAIKQACLQIIENDGCDCLTTQRIADVAGVNIASLYQYYPNKEAILVSLFEDFVQKAASEASSYGLEIYAISKQSMSAALLRIIDIEADLLVGLYDIHPEFYLEYRHNFDFRHMSDEKSMQKKYLGVEVWMHGLLEQYQVHLRDGDRAVMALLAESTMRDSLRAAMDKNPSLLRSVDFKREVLLLVMSYLAADESALLI